MIDLCTLGTGGAIPLPERALSSLYVRMDGHALLIDCGEGTQTQIRRLGWGFKCIDDVLITHYHADHCGGLPGFLLSMAKTGREHPLHIWGPNGLRRVIEALRVLAPQLPYPIVLHELSAGEENTFTACGLQVTAFPLDHGVPCLGYAFRLERGGAFDPEKARALGVPLPQWRCLQGGETVTLPDGTTVTPDQVTGAPRKGISFLYATDTRPVPAIARLGADTDLMVLEGMYDTAEKRPQALRNHHMLYSEAAVLAREAGTRALLLTHFSNCIDDPAEGIGAAQEIFPATQPASDLLTATLRYPEAHS